MFLTLHVRGNMDLQHPDLLSPSWALFIVTFCHAFGVLGQSLCRPIADTVGVTEDLTATDGNTYLRNVR